MTDEHKNKSDISAKNEREPPIPRAVKGEDHPQTTSNCQLGHRLVVSIEFREDLWSFDLA